jgi:hypothetical protein
LWWRDGDGDLVDELVDALTYLTEDGPIWLFTPKVGRAGYIEPSDIQDAAPTAGMSQTTSFPVGVDWTATRLIARHAGSNKRKVSKPQLNNKEKTMALALGSVCTQILS